MQSYAYGFPRLGEKREFKKIIESYWKGKVSEDKLNEELEKLENKILST
jgi:5-methyltetrahydropteroyltriglutamate--homocysteine methyltransferase